MSSPALGRPTPDVEARLDAELVPKRRLAKTEICPAETEVLFRAASPNLEYGDARLRSRVLRLHVVEVGSPILALVVVLRHAAYVRSTSHRGE